MRWFISYRIMDTDFLAMKERRCISFCNVVIDEMPSKWMRKHNLNYNILYAEQISDALASELVHGGAGIPAEYAEDSG